MNDPQQGFMTSSSPQPVKTLKFYSLLDEILRTKILTIFNVSSYEHLSIIIDESTNLNDLFILISKETKIPEKNLCLWLPSNHKFFEKNKGYENINSPLDFYMENYDSTNIPMMYVMNMQSGMEFCPPQPTIDDTIKHFFRNPQQAIKKHFLNEFVLKSLHFIRREQRQYLTLLSGLKFFAEQKAEELKKYPEIIPNLKRDILKCCGMMDQFLSFIKHGEAFMTNQVGCSNIYKKNNT